MWKCLNRQCPDRAPVEAQKVCYTCGTVMQGKVMTPVIAASKPIFAVDFADQGTLAKRTKAVSEHVNRTVVSKEHGAWTVPWFKNITTIYGGKLLNVSSPEVALVQVKAEFPSTSMTVQPYKDRLEYHRPAGIKLDVEIFYV